MVNKLLTIDSINAAGSKLDSLLTELLLLCLMRGPPLWMGFLPMDGFLRGLTVANPNGCHMLPCDVEIIAVSRYAARFRVLFRIEWKQSHAGVGRRKGLAGKLLNFPVVKKMMFVRLRRDLNPLALTMAA